VDWKLELVVLPVSDVDRAKKFYAEQLGFNVDLDHVISEELRIIQLTPPGSACSVMIGKGMGGGEPGSVKGLQLVVSDVEAGRAQLAERGVDVSPIRHMDNGTWVDGKGDRWNSFIFFDDPDGNSWTVQERPAEG
jgi:catechol 2,3-dioxygenase-like lactoylglutathione lyase family enzyme